MRIMWSEASHLDLRELTTRLCDCAKVARSVTLEDLVARAPEASTGLYFYLERREWMYVGRARSRALIERIPSHFDVRPEAWFGTLLRRLGERESPPCTPVAMVSRALDLRLAMLVADRPDVDLSSAEETLRHALLPKLNSPKKRRPVDLALALAEIG
jgi:hypothetical protein